MLQIIQSELASMDVATRDALMPLLRKLKHRVDYSEYGGAPLLGVNGVSVIGHGRSRAKAIASGIRAAIRGAESKFVDAIRETLPRLDEAAI
jgi:phosphate acyltransferase